MLHLGCRFRQTQSAKCPIRLIRAIARPNGHAPSPHLPQSYEQSRPMKEANGHPEGRQRVGAIKQTIRLASARYRPRRRLRDAFDEGDENSHLLLEPRFLLDGRGGAAVGDRRGGRPADEYKLAVIDFRAAQEKRAVGRGTEILDIRVRAPRRVTPCGRFSTRVP